jgi:tetratricopeptide (TPR) repeat protein
VKNPVTILLVLVLVVAAAAISRVAFTLDERRYSGDVVEELTYFPSGKFLKVADLGFDALVADVMWCRAIQYYGAHRKTDQAYPLAEHIFSMITDLDPQFVSAYRFGAIVLSEDVGASGAAIDLLRKGIRSNPETWEIPFDLGFLYFVKRNDWAKAAHYFRLASRVENSPEIAKRFTAFAYNKAGKTEVARALWEQLYASTGNRVIRDAAELAIKDIDLDVTLERLSELVARFHRSTGSFPGKLSDLVRAGLAGEIPRDPFDGFYFIDPTTKRVLSTTRVTREAARTTATLEKAVERYSRRTGCLPRSLDEIKSEGLLEKVPEVEGARVAYDPATGRATCDPVWKGAGR